MAKVTDQEIAVARVYSGAMLQLAESKGEADNLLAELLELVRYLDGDSAFEDFLSSPRIDVQAREKTIEKVFRGRVSDLLVDSLQVLNRKERLALLRAIVETYRLSHEELRGRIDVHVTTAIPLSKKMRQKLAEVASRHAGRQAELVETVNEAILGGMVVRIGDEKFDSSVATRLRTLGDALAERASQEIHSGKSYIMAG